MTSSEPLDKTVSIVDMLDRHLTVPLNPQRIVSLVPSQTELIAYLGGIDSLVGKTKFCIHPVDIKNVRNIGGTKNPNIELIKSLNPDLIIANKEENRKEDIEALQQHCPVWVSDVNNLDQSLVMIQSISSLINKSQNGYDLVAKLKKSLNSVRSIFTSLPNKNTIYMIWYKPWMMAGKDTFISDVMEHIGLHNTCLFNRYPVLKVSDEIKADIILLSSEPFPFQTKHIHEIQHLFPDAKVLLVDGEMFSWYGSRLLKFTSYVETTLKPQILD